MQIIKKYMKPMMLLCCISILVSYAATAQIVPKADFEKPANAFKNDCKQGNDFTADLGNSHLTNNAKNDLQAINLLMNRQLAALNSKVSAEQASLTIDSTKLADFEHKISTEPPNVRLPDENRAHETQRVLDDRKRNLNILKTNLFAEQLSYKEVQTLTADISKMEDMKNRTVYTDKINLIKADEDKIITALVAFAGTLK